MKKIIISVSIILTLCNVVNAQSSYSLELEKAAKGISQKIITSGKKSVAVLDFENSNKQTSELGSWLASVFTTHLENNSDDAFAVKNRTDIEKAIQQIKSESGSGAFDSKTIQRLGEISGSDVIVYGEITLMDNVITVNIRTKNISLNATIGGVLVNFTATEGMITKYDNYIETKTSSSGSTTTTNSGASGEGTARTSKNPNCKEKNIGDYCFQNNTKFNLTVTISPPGSIGGSVHFTNYDKNCTLQPSQKQCFYDLKSAPLYYCIKYWDEAKNQYSEYSRGSLYVDNCKEKTFIIK